MELFGLIGMSAYSIVGLVAGLRLLRLARRTGELPERLIGGAFLSGAMLGYPTLIVADRLRAVAPDPALVLFFVGWAGLVVAALCLLAFWQRVYHPDRIAARRTLWVGSALLVASLVGLLLTHSAGAQAAASPWYLPGLGAQGAAYALNGWASARYWRMLRRRLPLGLADPVVVKRILLWSTAAWAVICQYLYSTMHVLMTGQSSISGPGVAIISSLGLIAAGTILLAFFPPQSYLLRLERSSQGATG
jgi:Co/Zn/Cd efflux system component